MSKQYGKGFHDGKRKTRKEDLAVVGLAIAIGAGIAASLSLLKRKKKG